MFSSNTSQVSNDAVFVEDVFSTWLYTGNGSTQTITNGIDLSGKGGMVWQKCRSTLQEHYVVDTARGNTKWIETQSTAAEQTAPGTSNVKSFNATGFTLGGDYSVGPNVNGRTYASWTFRKQPKFFDVVTWTGDGVNGREINHSLESTPGTIIIKCTSAAEQWFVWHRSLNTQIGVLNLTDAFGTYVQGYQAAEVFGNGSSVVQPTSTNFTVAQYGATNQSGRTYVAYLFAHNAGGFGLTGTDNVISCGSAANGNSLVTLGWEPQWVLIKGSQGSTAVGDDWLIADNMRGMVYSGNTPYLAANKSSAENYGGSGGPWIQPTATGFQLSGLSGTGPFVYIAIRRGPMKTPTSGTSVFNAITRTGTGAAATITGIGFAPDLVYPMCRNDIANKGGWVDKLRGASANLTTNLTDAESTNTQGVTAFGNTSISVGTSSFFNSALNYVNYFFVRAPGFMDEVCYTGTGASSQTYNHNLGVAPELMIVKCRNTSTTDWAVYNSTIGATNYLWLNTTDQSQAFSTIWNNTAPTSSVFTVGSNGQTGASGRTYVAYLFASCPGVSKVGSYTGTGATQTISCGFAARFVLIKRTDSTGDWFVWDTARGMVAGTDPRLALNSTAAESNANWVYTNASGFQIVTTDATVNASGGSYIFLAIA